MLATNCVRQVRSIAKCRGGIREQSSSFIKLALLFAYQLDGERGVLLLLLSVGLCVLCTLYIMQAWFVTVSGSSWMHWSMSTWHDAKSSCSYWTAAFSIIMRCVWCGVGFRK